MHEYQSFASSYLKRFTRRMCRSIMAAADLHLLAVGLDRPITPIGDTVKDLAGLTRSTCNPSGVSRRIGDATLSGLYTAMLRDQIVPNLPYNYWVIDSKGFTLPWHSTDRNATLGPCDGRYSRGYRLHLIVDRYEQVWSARVTPLNVSEVTVAQELLSDIAAMGEHRPRGLFLADKGYDASNVFNAARRVGLVMLCRRRVTNCSDPVPAASPARYRAFLILEKFPKSHGTIAEQFVKLRDTAERTFAHLCGRGGGLTGLPPWVRRMPRVRAWVLAKLVLHASRRRARLLEHRPDARPSGTLDIPTSARSAELLSAEELMQAVGV